MSETNIIQAAFGSEREIYTDSVWQWNKGQVLRVSGITLPTACEAHVSNNGKEEAEIILFSGNDLLIYDSFFESGKPVYVWIYLTETTTNPQTEESMVSGTTEYMIVIPVKQRSKPAEYTPSDEQHDVIAQVIAAMNNTVTAIAQDKLDTEEAKTAAVTAKENAETAEGNAEQHAIDAAESEEAADRSRVAAEQAMLEAQQAAEDAQNQRSLADAAADAAEAASIEAQDSAAEAAEANRLAQATLQVRPTIVNGTWHVWNASTGKYEDTKVKAQGEQGEQGVGIDRISQNPNYTLTIYFTDGSQYTTSSMRGEKGEKGDTYTLTQDDRETIARIAENYFSGDVTRMYNAVMNAKTEIEGLPGMVYAESDGITLPDAEKTVTVDGRTFYQCNIVLNEVPVIKHVDDILMVKFNNSVSMPENVAGYHYNGVCLSMMWHDPETDVDVTCVINNLYTMDYLPGTLLFSKNDWYAFRVSQVERGIYFESLGIDAKMHSTINLSLQNALQAEAFGAGTRDGLPIESGDPAYHDNAPYYAEQAAEQAELAKKYVDGKDFDGEADPEFIENNANYLLGLTRQVKEEAETLVGDLAKEATLQEVESEAQQSVELLEQILAEGHSSGDLNGYSLAPGAGNEVILTYTDPETEEASSVIMITNTTGQAIAEALEEDMLMWKELVENAS